MSRSLIAAFAAVLLLAAAAAAAPVKPLALKTLTGVRKPGLLTVRIDLNKSWKSKLLVPSSTTSLRVLYDSNADGTADYIGRVVYRGTALVEEIAGHGNKYEPVPVVRPNAASARFAHPVDVIYANVAHKRTLRIAAQLKTPQGTRRTGWLTVPEPR